MVVVRIATDLHSATDIVTALHPTVKYLLGGCHDQETLHSGNVVQGHSAIQRWGHPWLVDGGR